MKLLVDHGRLFMTCTSLTLVLLCSCSDDTGEAPVVPPERAKTLAELNSEELEALCDFTVVDVAGDATVRRAMCTNGALAGKMVDPSLSCSEFRDHCVRNWPRERSSPCFAEPEAGGYCPESLVGEYLDCIAEYRQAKLEIYGEASCKDLSSYVSPSIEQQSEQVQDRAGCVALRDKCPGFFY